MAQRSRVVFEAWLILMLMLVVFHEGETCGGGRRRRSCTRRNGGWSAWRTNEPDCRCGRQRWYRHCDNPSPTCGGSVCSGSSSSWKDCDECASGCNRCEHYCHNNDGGYSCSCRNGYRLDGRYKCKRQTCRTSDWQAPFNGQMTSYLCSNGNTVSSGHVCTVRCNTGYELDPTMQSSSTCGSHGNWNPSSRARCKEKTCQPLRTSGKLAVSPWECLRSPIHGVVCYFKCRDDYTLEGSASTTCYDGRWTQTDYRCTDKEPPNFVQGCPNNISTHADEGKTTATVTWEHPLTSDNDGKRPHLVLLQAINLPHSFSEGSHVVTYIVRDTAWNYRSCSFSINVTVLRCSTFNAPINGEILRSYCNNIYGSTCIVDCNHGYELVGSVSRKCVKTGNNTVTWNGQNTSCDSIKCPALVTPLFATSGCSEGYIDYGTTCQFNCRHGYKAVNGSTLRTCGADRTWSGAELACEEITCPPLPELSTDSLTVDPPNCLTNRSSFSAVCSFRCKRGFEITGSSVTTCTGSGTWSAQANPSCADDAAPSFGSSCPQSILVYAEKSTTVAAVNWTTPTASDSTGVTPNITLWRWSRQPGTPFPAGEHIIRYVAFDRAGNTDECSFKVTVQVIYCVPKLLAPTSGSIDCTHDNKFGSECSISCRKGHILQGSPRRQCVSLGKPPGIWTGNTTTCQVVKCPVLEIPVHGIKSGCTSRGGTNIFGDTCLFYCRRGYRIIGGSKERNCQANGTWTGMPLNCTVIKCSALTSPKKGKVIPSVCKTTPEYGVTCQYLCSHGYRIRGPQLRTCHASGQWSHDESVTCIDVEKPSFGSTCPSNMRLYAERGVNYTRAVWQPIVTTDNSGHLPVVVSEGVQYTYEKGAHFVRYTATDLSGNTAVCSFEIRVEVLRCPSMLPPRNGFFHGGCYSTFGSTCHVKCNPGYNLLGSANQTCEVISGHVSGYWTNVAAVCKVQSCISLQSPSNGYLYPPMCAHYPVSGTNCTFGCYPGFARTGRVDYIHCTLDGKWNKDTRDVIKCRDITPPSFGGSCPSDIITPLNETGWATANWVVPTASDNSRQTPSVDVRPSGVKPPYYFNETTLITYNATDGAGNEKLCSFKVWVEDKLGPQVKYCPSDQNVTAVSMTTKVYWKTPEFRDNSNGRLTVYCNRNSGDMFYWGEWNVHCRAHDNNAANTPAVCTFVVRAKPKKCIPKIPPINGAMACDDWVFGKFCSPFCNDKWDFSQQLTQSIWACGASGVWFPSFDWPDCSAIYIPGSARKAISLHYFSGDCMIRDSKQQIKSQFVHLLNESVFKDVCRDKAFEGRCQADNVKVICAVVVIPSARKKRSSPTYIIKIEYEAIVGLEEFRNASSNMTSAEMKSWSSTASVLTQKISKETEQLFQNGSLSMTVNGLVLQPQNQSFKESATWFACSKGQIIKNGICVNCAAGTYLNASMGECLDCLKGSYQQREAQPHCHLCPAGMSTIGVRAGNVSECKVLCNKGFYSPNGLAPCYSCDKGYYQERRGQTKCMKCSGNTTTSSAGSVSHESCQVPCAPGTFSQTGLEPCKPCDTRSYQPLSERKSCELCPGTTITLRPGSKSSTDCIEINECDSNPCLNNGACIDLVGAYRCQCPTGFTGNHCETDIDYCNGNPCFNNATCYDQVKNFTCACSPGFQGATCSDDVDECENSPCHNNGSCENLVNSFKCLCKSGYKGVQCKEDINECIPNPCFNNGSCIDLFDDFQCNCPDGFHGKHCEIDIDNCTSSPCQNVATCIDGINDYECKCQNGFTGKNCEKNIDECATSPCKNNATCYDGIYNYDCVCIKGYNGTNCEYEIDECQSNPCKNSATCLDIVGAFECACDQGFDGILCDNNIDDCASEPCAGNASCHDKVNDFKCVCPPGFTGKLCNIDINECVSKPCYNNASCSDGINKFRCHCRDGFNGHRCEENIDNCKGNPCNNGNCTDGINKYNCTCLPGFTGLNCDIDINECASNPCTNEGHCDDLVDDFSCNCRPGFRGKNCSVDIDNCIAMPCKNNATCIDGVNSFRCECASGFTGSDCNINIDECRGNNCSNGASCVDGFNGYSCACAAGYVGIYCEMEVDECASYPCEYGATCIDKLNGYTCECHLGFNGSTCKSNIDDCGSSACLNGATCFDLVNNYTCKCQQGYEGYHCEIKINYCLISNCSENAVCSNTLEGFVCNCSSGYYGRYCEFEINECEPTPCMEGATCIDKLNGFECHCQAGFTGRLCKVNIDDCFNNSCLNNATCIDKIMRYDCSCNEGYNGSFCEKEVNECEPNPCLNNGTCQDLIGGYTCNCTDDFAGVNCENATDPCNSGPCINEGQCNSNDSFNYNCACVPGYTGRNCELNIDDCASRPCTVNSFCTDLVNGYKCKCLPAFAGDNCDIPLGNNFDLEFTHKTATATALSNDADIPNLGSFSLAFWMKTISRTKVETLFSYRQPDDANERFKISVGNTELNVLFKSQIIRADDVHIRDGSWHCIGFVRQQENGTLILYLDGKEVKRETDVHKEEWLLGGGSLALGQNYSMDLKTFLASDSFVGSIHQLHVWDFPVTASNMWSAAHSCNWPIGGNVLAWVEFLSRIHGLVVKRFPSRCKVLESCSANCSHVDHCYTINGDYHCKCLPGYTGTYCDVDIDDCVSKPCVHGRCNDAIGGYRCICNKGYFGGHCEKKIKEQKVCHPLKQIEHGRIPCENYEGKQVCHLKCDKGYSLKKFAVTTYGCGPETNWKWNKENKLQLPSCLKATNPVEARQKYSVTFPMRKCQTNEQFLTIKKSLTEAVVLSMKTLPVYDCFKSRHCRIDDVKIEGCEQFSTREERSVDDDVNVEFAVVLRDTNDPGDTSTVTEKSEAVLFNLKYMIATGNFALAINERNITAKRASLQFQSSTFSCNKGYVPSNDNASCVVCPAGTYHKTWIQQCDPCSIGTFQNVEAQTSCKTCPKGSTTKTKGASLSSDCSGVVLPETSTPWPIVGGVLTAVFIVLAVFSAVYYFCLYARRAGGLPQRTASSINYSDQSTSEGDHYYEEIADQGNYCHQVNTGSSHTYQELIKKPVYQNPTEITVQRDRTNLQDEVNKEMHETGC